ncbi:hypothetical protein IJ182_08770 [bacterium]|nr:hypothetical protein [bacterium]
MTTWNEADHPRDDEGKFTYKGGGSSTQKSNEDKMHEIANILYSSMEDKNDYWEASGADKIDNPVGALIVFDTAVLRGPGRAKQFYKQANGDFNKMIQLRKDYYIKRVKDNPTQQKFLKGWNNRADNLTKKLKEYEESYN